MRTNPFVSATGLVLAWIGYVASLTPTMVPRTTSVQVVMSTLLPLTGYAIGATVGALARAATGQRRWLAAHDRARRIMLALYGLAVLLALAVTPLALQWQTDLVQAAGWTLPSWPLVIGVAPLLVALLVLVGRAFRAAGRVLGRQWARVVRPPWLASALGGVSIGLTLVGLVVGGFLLIAHAFISLDASTTDHQRPTSDLRSGGPASLVEWEGLGWQGRKFVSEGPTAAMIEGFSGEPAPYPVRAYVGQQQADGPEGRAALLVDEVRRLGGFERSAVVVIVTSGLGSVHPVSVQTLEYVANGDVASAATQFSRIPSWMTSIVDPGGAEREARALVEAFTTAIGQMPTDQQPELYLHGESLGASGSQNVFVGQTPEQVVEDFAGVLWVGTPAASTLMQEWSSFPEGTPAWEPVVGDGSVARFAASPDRVAITDETWGPERILFLHSAHDPVAYLQGSIWRDRPDWLGKSRFDTLPERMAWWPLFTWEQMLIDFTTNGIVPPGFGHNYSHAHGAGWAAVLHPEGWDADTVARLEEYRVEVGPPDPGVPTATTPADATTVGAL